MVLGIFSVGYWTFFFLTMPIFFVVALVVFLVTWPFDRRRVVLHLYSCFWASFYVYVNPLWRVQVVGAERLPWRGPAVIVANHLSVLDILILFGLYRPFKWVSKAVMFRVPALGWNMVLNDYVPLERGNRDSVQSMMAHCHRHLAAGSPVFIFPEGTRSKDGRLQPFKDGAFHLALEANVPVFPVVITGTHEALPKHGLILRQRMNARVVVLEPLDPLRFGDVASLREATAAAIAGALSAADS
jgi:1-acyl-sn-glycerol-3-phosphate acyltransferase